MPKSSSTKKNPAAVALGRRGGLKGGKARMARLSKAERQELARKAAQARWQKPKSERVREFLQLRMAGLEYEVFAALFLCTRLRLIDYTELFRGTIDGASIHPREVVKEALARNAAAVIVAHNHPSGDSSPSGTDRDITHRLDEALDLVGIRLIDHLIVGETITSFAESDLW